MKNLPLLIKTLASLSLLAFAAGCMTNAQFKEANLTQAGFKSIPANTPERQAHLKTLSTTKVTPVQRNGQTYYVFPDPAKNVLYVGRQAEYNAYKQIKLGQQQRADYDMAVQNNFVSTDATLTSFNTWGTWDGLPWGY